MRKKTLDKLETEIQEITINMLHSVQKKSIKEVVIAKLMQSIEINKEVINDILQDKKIKVLTADTLIAAKDALKIIGALPLEDQEKLNLKKAVENVKRNLGSLRQQQQSEDITLDLLLHDVSAQQTVSREKKSSTSKQSFASLVKESIRLEATGELPQWITIHTLLCLLWFKAEDRNNLQQCFDEIAKRLEIAPNMLYTLPHAQEIYSIKDKDALLKKQIEELSLSDLIYVCYTGR